MSAFVRAFLFCNGCGATFDNSAVPSACNVTEARRDARRGGWTRKRDGRDLCDDCSPRPAAPPARPERPTP